MNTHIELPLARPGALALELTRAEKALNLFSAGQVDSVMDEEGSSISCVARSKRSCAMKPASRCCSRAFRT